MLEFVCQVYKKKDDFTGSAKDLLEIAEEVIDDPDFFGEIVGIEHLETREILISFSFIETWIIFNTKDGKIIDVFSTDFEHCSDVKYLATERLSQEEYLNMARALLTTFCEARNKLLEVHRRFNLGDGELPEWLAAKTYVQ